VSGPIIAPGPHVASTAKARPPDPCDGANVIMRSGDITQRSAFAATASPGATVTRDGVVEPSGCTSTVTRTAPSTSFPCFASSAAQPSILSASRSTAPCATSAPSPSWLESPTKPSGRRATYA
jgi:hypothetical protein